MEGSRGIFLHLKTRALPPRSLLRMEFTLSNRSVMRSLISGSITMPSLSINFNPAVGPLINLAIEPVSFAPNPANPVNLRTYMALIDTGASHTAISAKVITDLGLTPIGKQPVGGVHGQHPTNLYQFQVVFFFPQARWIPTRSATPSTALVPQRKVGFPIPNAGLLLGFQGTKTARREGISSPFSDAEGCTSPQNSGAARDHRHHR